MARPGSSLDPGQEGCLPGRCMAVACMVYCTVARRWGPHELNAAAPPRHLIGAAAVALAGLPHAGGGVSRGGRLCICSFVNYALVCCKLCADCALTMH